MRKKSSATRAWRGLPTLAWTCAAPLLALGWVRFGLVGLSATAAYAILGLALVSGLGLAPLYGNSVAFALSFVVSYLGHRRWTFRSSKGHSRSLPRFALVQGLGLALNSGIIWLAMKAGTGYPMAMLLAIVACPALVYLLCRIWVFGQPESGKEK